MYAFSVSLFIVSSGLSLYYAFCFCLFFFPLVFLFCFVFLLSLFLKETKPILLGASRWTQIHSVARYWDTCFIPFGTFVFSRIFKCASHLWKDLFLLELLADWCTVNALKITLETV